MRVVTMSRKPIDGAVGTVAANALKWGCGGMDINATRIGTDGGTRREGKATKSTAAGWSNMGGHSIAELDAGRWPANLVMCSKASDALDNQSGISTSAKGTVQYTRAPTSGWVERGGYFIPGREWEAEGYGDTWCIQVFQSSW